MPQTWIGCKINMCQIFEIICKNLYIFYTRTSKIYEHILLRRATWNCAAYCVPRSGVSLGWCFFYSSNIQHMHSHKYWRWTICFTLHRKAFELIKIFVRLSKKHEHNAKYGIEWAPSSHIYEAIQNGIMMHFSFCNIIYIWTCSMDVAWENAYS